MFRAVRSGPSIIACSTCRCSAEAREDGEGKSGGERLAGALRRLAAGDLRYGSVDVETMPCLFACDSFCTVFLRAPGKVGYVLGRFEPTPDAATAILEFALRYAASEHGRVAYKEWPEGVKGHFLVRVPPEGKVVA